MVEGPWGSGGCSRAWSIWCRIEAGAGAERPAVRSGVDCVSAAALADAERVDNEREGFSFNFSFGSDFSEDLSEDLSDFSALASVLDSLSYGVSPVSVVYSSSRAASSGTVSSASRDDVKPEPSLRVLEREPLKPAGLAVLIASMNAAVRSDMSTGASGENPPRCGGVSNSRNTKK